MSYYSQTDKVQPFKVNSTSGDTMQPKYIRVFPQLIQTADDDIKKDDLADDLTKEEEEKFYSKIMKTTLL